MPITAYKTKKLYLSDGLEIAYIEEGSGEETILYIHGLGSNKWAWVKNMSLSPTPSVSASEPKQYRCIALDLVGYGQSSAGDFPYTMAFFADVIKRFIEVLKLKNVTLVGHSMGGQIAMTLVLKGISSIKKLVLAAPAGFETFNSFEKILLKNTYSPFLIKMQSKEQVWLNYDMSFYKMPTDAEFMIKDRMELTQVSDAFENYAVMISKCVNSMLNEPVFDRIQNIQQPTLIIFGTNDLLIPNRLLHPTATPLSIAERGHKKIHHSQIVGISQAGHFVQFEAAKRFNELLLQFI